MATIHQIQHYTALAAQAQSRMTWAALPQWIREQAPAMTPDALREVCDALADALVGYPDPDGCAATLRMAADDAAHIDDADEPDDDARWRDEVERRMEERRDLLGEMLDAEMREPDVT